MPFAFERFVALRYLRGAEGRAESRTEGRAFLRFIIYVAIGGVAVGVAALLLALSIVRGFSSEIEEKIVGFGAHVQVKSYQDAPLEGAAGTAQQLRRLAAVDSVALVVEDFALLRRSRQQIDGVAVWGTEAPPAALKERMASGRFAFAPDAEGRPGLVVGQALAERLGIQTGDAVTAFSTPGLGGSSSVEGGGGGLTIPQPRVKAFHVAGVYETALNNFDDLYVFTDLETARGLLGFGADEVTRFDVTLRDVQDAALVAEEINETYDFPLRAVTVFEAFSGLFAWINLQESITPLVIGVIVLVAAFNIIGTLLMLMLEKTREIGVLGSLGASAKTLRRLFLGLGLLIGGAGTALGAALALVLALLQKQYEIIPLPAEAYYMTAAPIELSAWDFVGVAVVTLMLCAAAAYVPARAASRIEPVRAIRFR